MTNPTGAEEVKHRNPREILDEIAALDAESVEVLGRFRGLVAQPARPEQDTYGTDG